MGYPVQKWVADDGKEFSSKREMLLHELTLLDHKEIDIWLSQQDVSTKRMNEYRKLLRLWQYHIRSQEVEPLEETLVEAQSINELNPFT